MQGRERKKITAIGTLLQNSLKDVEKLKRSGADKDAQFCQERLSHMLEFYELFDRLFSAFLSMDDFQSTSTISLDVGTKKEQTAEEDPVLHHQLDYDHFYRYEFDIPAAPLN